MFSRSLLARAALAAAVGALSASVTAQTQDAKAALRRSVDAALGQVFPSGRSDEVLGRLANIRPQGMISRGFDLGRVRQLVFGRITPVSAPDCRAAVTAGGEPDEGLCIVEEGKRDDQSGAPYNLLAYSKNIGIGTIRVAHRAPFAPGGDPKPVGARMSDEEAYKKALEFVELLGVPTSEVPLPVPGATRPLPVRTLVAGSEAEPGKEPVRVNLHKVVVLPRAFEVPGGLLRDPATGRPLNHVVAPGSAMVVLDDAGVQFARVDGWSDAQMDTKLGPAKPLAELAAEITDDLYDEGVRRVGSMSILIALRRAYPNPEDPNPPLCPVCGVLRPAVKVMVSQVGRDPVPSSEKAVVAPGMVREYDLCSGARRAGAGALTQGAFESSQRRAAPSRLNPSGADAKRGALFNLDPLGDDDEIQ